MKKKKENSLITIWKENKILSLCIMVGFGGSILFYIIFNEILWMGIICFWIGVMGLYRKNN